jgi:SAM-dependent methyltransferase
MDPATFYDEVAPYYHLLLPGGFEAGAANHAEVIHNILEQRWDRPAHTVLDVSCGVGTQAIGLAQRGYQVSASDISEKAIERAKRFARDKRMAIPFSVADMRRAHAHHGREFDAVIALDNGLTYLLDDAEIGTALGQIYRCCRPGGGFVASVHDYESEDRRGRQIRPYGIKEENGYRYFIFQVWEFDGNLLDLTLYVVRESVEGHPETRVMRTRTYAIAASRLMQLMEEAGFEQVERIDYAFAQPIYVGKRGLGRPTIESKLERQTR